MTPRITIASGRPKYIWMKRMPSVAPWPGVPIMVTAESWVAITESPTTHQGRLLLARKYPWMVSVSFDLRMPSMITYAR